MALDKQPSATNGSTTVTLSIPAEAGAKRAELLGEFNHWTPAPMRQLEDGRHEITLELEAGHTYRFRYLLDGSRWENDWQADAYVPNDYGGDDSVIDLLSTQDHADPDAIPRRHGETDPAARPDMPPKVANARELGQAADKRRRGRRQAHAQ